MSDVSTISSEFGEQNDLAATWPVSGPAGNDTNLQYMIVGFKPKSALITSLPSGWTQIKRNDAGVGYDGASVLLASSLGATTTQKQDFNIGFDSPVQGTWGSATIDGELVGAIVETVGGFATTHTLGSKTSAKDGSCVYGLKVTGAYPKYSTPVAPLQLPGIVDSPGTSGPSTAIAAAPADDGVTIAPEWESTDRYGNPANDGDAFTGYTLLVAPVDTNTISGGGTIPIRGVKSVTITLSPASIQQGGSGSVTAQVIGTDDQPFEGISVDIVSAGASVDADTKTSDASGNVTFNLTGTVVGNHSVSIGVDTEIDTVPLEVTAVESAAVDSVSLTASLSNIQAGQAVTLLVVGNKNGSPTPERSGTLTYTLPGQSEIVKSFTTSALGQFTERVTPMQTGTLAAQVTIDGVDSNALSLTISAAAQTLATPPALTLNVGGEKGAFVVTRGGAAVSGLTVLSENAAIATASSVTDFNGSVVVTPVSVGATSASVVYIDPNTGNQTAISILVLVEAALMTGDVTSLDIKLAGGSIKVGDAPVIMEFVDQADRSIVDDNVARMKVEQSKPELLAISHATDDGKFWVVALGSGDTTIHASYRNEAGVTIRKSFDITVIR